jgi:hypothetical protein
MFLGDCDAPDEVIGLALKKSALDLEVAIGMVIDPDQIAILTMELSNA